MDLTLVVYVARQAEYLAQLLAELFQQCDDFKLEFIAVDGGTLQIDFDKLDDHCRKHNIEFSVIRQDPMGRAAPGFHAAAYAARGSTLVFMNPAIRLPQDFLKIAYAVGQAGKVLVPRAWLNIVAPSTECWGFWAPPDGMSLILPREAYTDDLLGECTWESSAWPKADAYLLASKLAAHSWPVGMATVGEFEYRRWTSSHSMEAYMAAVEKDYIDVGAGVLNDRDIRRCTVLGVPFEEVTERVVNFQAPEEIETRVRQVVRMLQEKHARLGDPARIAAALQEDLDRALDDMFGHGLLLIRPQFVAEAQNDGGKGVVRVRSTGILLPHELGR